MNFHIILFLWSVNHRSSLIDIKLHDSTPLTLFVFITNSVKISDFGSKETNLLKLFSINHIVFCSSTVIAIGAEQGCGIIYSVMYSFLFGFLREFIVPRSPNFVPMHLLFFFLSQFYFTAL